MKHRRTYLGLAGLASFALAVAGCSGNNGADDAAEASDVTTLKVGVLPNIEALPIYIAAENGIFEEHGLKVEPVPAQGGAALLPAVLEGSTDIGFSNILTHMTAVERGLGTTIVASGPHTMNPDTLEPVGEHNSSVLAVTSDSGIEDVSDLAGKTISVNALGGIQEVAVRNAIDSTGGDSESIELVELPLSQAEGALSGGRVDAVSVNEPFTTVVLEAGHREIASPFSDFEHAASNVSIYFATEAYAEENPEVIERFRAALDEVNAYINENPDEAREQLDTYTDIDAQIRQKVTLPFYETRINEASVEEIMQKGAKYGVLESELPLEDIIGNAPTLTGTE
ncbi:MAG TPA: ABC transporter substrate-binding protein [Enteractinococcus helveticum]|uniref:ABC transporter substrate-binding protein n=1 Tax=Enteractinococcus helveticum TaxID=1837282 RepID=A0A921K7N7_9MICC|nr:ABC transporter substrate-binding protein [Enteractinococcus helveticum]HJF13464.1 ABC transporter substrate-binding protein [Enteractinococcus helveticum]